MKAALAFLGAALVAALAFSAYHYRGRALAAESEAAGLRGAIEIMEEQRRRQQVIQREREAFDHETDQTPGADSPLSDFLLDRAGKLWP